MEAIHNFLDSRVPIPPMDVEDINVLCSQVLQTSGMLNDITDTEIVLL